LHTPLAQSLPIVQPPPVPQRAHVEAPPQSTPDSEPFFTASVQLGAWHAVIVQTPLAQSAGAVHARLVAQRGQVVAPPQSVSLSPPFFTVSVHVGALHVLDVQTPLTQSSAIMHALLVAQRGQVVEPPQSVSLSPWFLTMSEHVGALHVSGGPVHTRLWQSVDTAQVLFVPHAPQVGPPQSMSVSLPFLLLSVHPGV
jgi:hypothetical protein